MAVICTAILAASIITPSYDDYWLARRNLDRVERFRLVLDAANRLSAERGPSNAVMGSVTVPASDAMQQLAQFRSASDAAVEAIANPVTSNRESVEHPIPTRFLEQTTVQLKRARMQVDRVASLPFEQRRLEDVQGAIESMFAVVDDFQLVVAWNVDELVDADDGIAAPVLIGHMLSDLREYGGRIASQIMAPIATRHPLERKHLIDSSRTRGRLNELWRLVGGQDALFRSDSRLAGKHEEIQRIFFGDGLDMLDALVAEGRTSGNYSLTAEDFTERFVKTLQPLESLRREFLNVKIDELMQTRDRALRTLMLVIAVAIAILTILAGIVHMVHRSVLSPLLQARDEVIGLAQDRPVELGNREGYAGEMRRLFDAIQILRGKLLERAVRTDKLKEQAETDGLTGLFNRRTLDLIGQSKPEQGGLAEMACLILMDIDYFKLVNDSYGHQAGDLVLREVAGLLRTLLRPADVVARFGGEEFAVLSSGDQLSDVVVRARRLRLALQRHEIVLPDGVRLNMTASFGVASGSFGTDEWPRLIKAADIALYRAKTEGRNRVRFAAHDPLDTTS
ncbi:GGDEF domain-containing protein [Phyllobacterium myrsinacearum]|uniref:diguanylate cyclase n=1 Tax=Phyllobacterium myrsinacearum TaxID=28101 RepID=A0A839EUP8_9HYPH|nr:GGDEF domain-containing protein [Phyllobacterium myrsinacearum]MBA8881898.1 diguanylate cyclase (GGDEF)-like protein [Phyllobacterium myrsinacearum]